MNSSIQNEMEIKSFVFTVDSYFEEYVFSINNYRAHSSIKAIDRIKSSLSKNKKRILICYRDNNFNSRCLYYDYNLNKFNNIDYSIGNCLNLETYYFDEENKYFIICNISNPGSTREFKIIVLNEDFEKEIIQGKDEFKITLKDCDELNGISLVYSESEQDYILISDCIYFQFSFLVSFFY